VVLSLNTTGGTFSRGTGPDNLHNPKSKGSFPFTGGKEKGDVVLEGWTRRKKRANVKGDKKDLWGKRWNAAAKLKCESRGEIGKHQLKRGEPHPLE